MTTEQSRPAPPPVQQVMSADAAALQQCLVEAKVGDAPLMSRYGKPLTVLPAVLVKFVAVSVVFRLDKLNKWRVALAGKWLPEAVVDWLGMRQLDRLLAALPDDWVEGKAFVNALAERAGVLLISIHQPRPGAVIRQTIRRLFFHKRCMRDGGLCAAGRYAKSFLRQAGKPLRRGLHEEARERVRFALGQFEETERARRVAERWVQAPQLSEENRAILEAAKVEDPSEPIQALREGFDAGLFDFIGDLLLPTYSTQGRRPIHPVFLWRVLLAMLAVGTTKAGEFLRRVNDSIQLRLFLGVMSKSALPSARTIDRFPLERLAPVAEYVVLWFNTELLAKGGLAMGDEFGTDGIEMAAQARTKSDAVRAHLQPHLTWLWGKIHAYLREQGRTELTEVEHAALLDALRELDWGELGSARKSKYAILRAVADAFGGEVMTPRSQASVPGDPPPAGRAPPAFLARAASWAKAFGERVRAFGDKFDWDTLYDRECGAQTKYGKTIHGFGMEFVVDLAYGLVWAFAVFPAGQRFQPYIKDYLLGFQQRHGLGSIKTTSDREFTIAWAMDAWDRADISHYGPRSDRAADGKGIFTERDFEIHELHAVCPNGKILKRKPKMNVRGSSKEWRYQARKTDCGDCPLRAQCTTGKGPRVLGVNVHREAVARHAARMEAEPEVTADLLARHRSLVEGTVNNLKNHQGTKRAWWKGLAMARLQFALAIVMLNLLKWRKIRHGQLENLKVKRAREAAA